MPRVRARILAGSPLPALRTLCSVLTAAAVRVATAAVPAQGAVCQVSGAIGDYWRSIGGERSFLGPCTSGELAIAGGVVQHFRAGSVYWSRASGAREVHGAIGDAYGAAGGPASVLRFPVTHEKPTPTRPGAFNHFQGGSIYWSRSTGAHIVLGAIRETWARAGWESGLLGFPTSSERATATGSGRYSHFEGGSVYWSEQTGAHVVRGAIRQAWWAAGAEARLGLPLVDETPTPVKPGAFSHFQGGSVYWSPLTGAHLVHGAIRGRWSAMGRENSWLGFPTSSEYAVPGGRRSDFEGGSILWDAATGTIRVLAGPRPAYTFTVRGVAAADLPASYRPGCPVEPARLRLINLSYVDVGGATRTGELVVADTYVTAALKVFDRLYTARFPVQRMQRVDVFGGSDDASMEANNTSAFNCRRVAGGTSWSEHAYGRAIDVNPVQNLYVDGSFVAPDAGRAHLDRRDVRPGMVVVGDAFVRAFAEQGWAWGGAWTSIKDYQHFSATGR